MCDRCGYANAMRIMDRLKSIKLTRLYKRAEQNKHISRRMWRAVLDVAEAKNERIHPHELPEDLGQFHRKPHPWSKLNPPDSE